MFITVSPMQRPEPRGLLARIRRALRDRFHPPSAVSRRVEVLDSFFTDIRVPDKAFGEEWGFLSGESCRFVLCPQSLELPPGWFPAVRAEDVNKMLAHILCSTALYVLEISRLPLRTRCVGLVDPDGKHPDLLERFIHTVSEILVLTRDTGAYQGDADRLLEEYGAPVTFIESAPALARATLALNFGNEGLPCLRPVPILTIQAPDDTSRNLYIESPDFSLPQADQALPPAVEKAAFYAALYERCGIRGIYDLRMTDGVCGKRRVSSADIAGYLERNGGRA